MRFLLIASSFFVAGVWFALENPMVGKNIKSYAELAVMYLSSFIGG
ncbi:hypothetical protein VCRA2110O2_30178 [Vibrio crassostreae]|nr:hypothetical protein VCHA44O286_50197 [Vibrio chagasii]CAK2857703.1 hypothetical protein VCRA2110O2_30178 [Vibrio crassostreae]